MSQAEAIEPSQIGVGEKGERQRQLLRELRGDLRRIHRDRAEVHAEGVELPGCIPELAQLGDTGGARAAWQAALESARAAGRDDVAAQIARRLGGGSG